MKAQFAIFAAALTCGCSPNGGPEPSGADPVLLETTAASNFTFEPRSLCELTDLATVVGHYEVERIVSELGPNLRGAPRTEPYITVTLTGKSFVGANAPITMKMQGGVWPDGSVNDTTLALEAGESVIAFLWTEWGDGTYQPHPDAVLHDRGDGTFENEYLMANESLSADDLEERVLDIKAGDCVDVRPNGELATDPEPASDESPHPVDMGHVPDVGK